MRKTESQHLKYTAESPRKTTCQPLKQLSTAEPSIRSRVLW